MADECAHLSQITKGRCRKSVPLAGYTTWRIGGPADLFVEPQDEAQLAAVLAFCKQEGLSVLLLAGGSNLLCHDAGLRGVALRLPARAKGFGRMERRGEFIEAGAGCSVPELARFAAAHGLSGLEHAANIPGSLGGLIAMNGGSRRRSISDSLLRVFALAPDGQRLELPPEACGFGYRSSQFQNNGLVVTGAVLRLQQDDPEAVRQRIQDDLEERSRKFPLELPSCGSVFTSHEELFARHGPPGKVIEDCGLKGLRKGDLEVSHKHANFMVNHGKGLAADALWLMARVREAVYRRTGVAMECEVRHADASGKVAAAHAFLPPLA